MLVILLNHSHPGKTIGDCGGMEDGVGGGAPPPGAGESKGGSPEQLGTIAASPGAAAGAAAGESALFATGGEPIAAIAVGAGN